MGCELTSEAQEGIERLSYEIAMRRRLDFDGRKEIAGHIEDKVLGYLDGEETLSEDDALLLAREHFGGKQIAAEFDPSSILDSGRAMMRTLAIGVLPYGIALFVAGCFIDLFGITVAPVLFAGEMNEYFIFAMAGGVIFVLFMSISITKRVHQWANTLSSKQLARWSVLILIGNAFTTVPSLRYAALTELPREFTYIWAKGPSDNMVVFILLVVMACVYCGYLALTYRFLDWAAQKHHLTGAFVGLGFWYVWHVFLFGVHVVAAPLMLWILPTLRSAGAFESFHWFTWRRPEGYEFHPETLFEMGIAFINDVVYAVVGSLNQFTLLWSNFSELLSFNRYVLLIGILAFALRWARHSVKPDEAEVVPTIQGN